MSIKLEYKDSLSLVSTTLPSDGYGTEIIDEIYDVSGLFLHTTGLEHVNYRSDIVSDAECYLDPENETVQSLFNRLEGMYLIANRFGNTNSQEWYKIERVVVGEDKLLTNQIDNIQCYLNKTSEVPNVS